MNIIDERDKRTVIRKLRKKEYDEMINLSVSKGPRVRLLDEGMVVDGSGQPLFYLAKGTIEKYYESLPDDYEGSINVGHMEFATFPFLIGKWKKSDLSVVDNGDGRKGLEVDLRLDEDSIFVKEFRRLDYDLAVSAEFSYHKNEELTKKVKVEVIDEIFIYDFAVVGEPGNVNSSGIRLKGGTALNLKELQAAIDSAGTEATIEELNKKLDALTGEEATEEVKEEPAVEETQEEPTEEPKEEEPKEETEEEVKEEEPKEDEALSVMAGAIEGLQKELEVLRKQNADLQARLEAKLKAEQDFISKFKNLSVSLSTQREEPVVEEEVYTDGIGE